MNNHSVEVSIPGSNLQNYSETYEKWDNEEGEVCTACYGTGLDRDEMYECPACWGEGYVVPVDVAL